MALVNQFAASLRSSGLTYYAVPLLLLAAYVVLNGYHWLRMLRMDHKHNQGRFLMSRWNGVSNLITLHKNLDNHLYDWLANAFMQHHVEFAGRTAEDLLESPPTIYPNTIITLPVFRMTFLSNPVDLEYVLKKNFDNYPKGPMFSGAVKDLLGEGIFAVDGHKWKSQRKTASHEFTVDKFRSYYMETFNKNTHRVLNIIDAKQGTTVEIQGLFQRYTLESIAELGFGVALGCLESDEPPPFAVAFDAAQVNGTYSTVCTKPTVLSAANGTYSCLQAQLWRRIVTDQMTWKVSKLLNIGQEGEMKEWIRTLREFTQDVIDKRRRQLASQPDAVRTGGDILSRFMLMVDAEGKAMTDQQLRDVVLNFIIAGRDTTSNALSWATNFIAEHPLVEDKLREELQDIGSDPNYAEMAYKRRPYLHAVVHETLRLYPSVPMEIKMALNDDVLPDGTYVPAGSMVSFSPYILGRNPGLWGSDAAEFRPERWLDSEGNFQRVSQYKFPAFNGGFRLCLGMDLAFLEMKTMLAHLFTNYRVSKIPDQQVEYAITLTCPMKQGLKVVLVPVEKE